MGSSQRFSGLLSEALSDFYHHNTQIRNCYLANGKSFQDGNGNGSFEEINSNDFLDGNWESLEMKG